MKEVRQEVEHLIKLIFHDRDKQGSFDLEAAEIAIRDSMHHCGALLLDQILKYEDGESLGQGCACGGFFVNKHQQSKTIRTVLGKVRVMRSYQQCTCCGRRRFPADVVLDVVKTGFSPGLRRIMAKTGSLVCFDKARDLILDIGGVHLTDKDVERVAEAVGAEIALKEDSDISAVMAGAEPGLGNEPEVLYIATDGTGVPVLRRETEGRRGKAADGIARTREAKIGVVFTQSGIDEKGNPVRDPGSTTYVGKIEPIEDFAPRLYTEAQQRGAEKAKKVAVLGDGAPWIWNMADEHFPDAIQILDYYHAKEHLWDLSKVLFADEDKRQEWVVPLSELLWEGRIGAVIDALRRIKTKGKKKKAVDATVRYFEKNASRMNYRGFRDNDLFIGSGVVEAGCKSLISRRLKQSGMHWSVRGANAIIALRCCIESNKFEDYWESRRAA